MNHVHNDLCIAVLGDLQKWKAPEHCEKLRTSNSKDETMVVGKARSAWAMTLPKTASVLHLRGKGSSYVANMALVHSSGGEVEQLRATGFPSGKLWRRSQPHLSAFGLCVAKGQKLLTFFFRFRRFLLLD